MRAVAALARPKDAATAQAEPHLPPAALSLFQAMPRYDQQHALNVLHTLQSMGHHDPDLLAAALLHDAGKTAGQAGTLHLWHRVAVVLMRAFAPDLLARTARDQPGSWRQPFFVQQHHAEIGAELARQTGCSPRTADLIRRHEESPDRSGDPLLAALQAADSAN
jgi:putative nucleotidyltransferase with HDIG domain